MAAPTRPLAEPAPAPSPAARRAAARARPVRADSSGWYPVAAVAVLAGSVAAGVASLAGHAEWQLAAIGSGAAVAAVALGLGIRDAGRRHRIVQAAGQLAPVIGRTAIPADWPDRVLRVRWPIGALRHHPPRRVTVRPPASCQLTDPARLEWIAQVAGRAFGVQLRAATVHRRRHELVLVPARLADPDPETATVAPRELRCAEVVVEQRLGRDGRIVATTATVDEDRAEHLDALEVRFTPTTDNTEPQFWVDFEAAFNRQVPGRWRATADLVVDPETKRARCDIRRQVPLPTRIPFDLGRLDQCGKHQIPYALDEHGRLVTWQLDISPHLLVSGAARSGKSSTLRTLVRGFVARGWAALICDPKRTGLLGLRGWPGVQTVATSSDPRHLVAVIEYVHRAMHRRYAAVEAGRSRREDLDPILLVLDEYREMHDEIRAWWERPGSHATAGKLPSEPAVFEQIDAIARLGGEIGVHLVIGAKRPDVDVGYLPDELVANSRCRCSHGALTREESEVMWGNAVTGRSVPPMIQGRGTALRADGTPGEIQALWLPDPLGLSRDDRLLYRRLEPTASSHTWLELVDGSLVPTDTPPETPWMERADADRVSPDDLDVDLPWEPFDADLLEWDLRYGETEMVAAGQISEADLVEVESGSDIWVVVDDVTADPDEPDLLYIDGRVVDSGQPKTIVAAEDAVIARRRQVDSGP